MLVNVQLYRFYHTRRVQVCVAKNGAVLSLKTQYSICSTDDEIHQTLRTWRCTPWPVPSCFELEFQFVSE